MIWRADEEEAIRRLFSFSADLMVKYHNFPSSRARALIGRWISKSARSPLDVEVYVNRAFSEDARLGNPIAWVNRMLKNEVPRRDDTKLALAPREMDESMQIDRGWSERQQLSGLGQNKHK